jgi:hypothetical protein
MKPKEAQSRRHPERSIYQLRRHPARITYSQFGEAQVLLDPQTGGVLQLEDPERPEPTAVE